MTDPDPLQPAADLDGHTFEQLAEYVDRGRTPVDPSIEDSPACRRVIAALERLRSTSLRADLEASVPVAADDAWTTAVMAQILGEARAGADFVLARTPGGDAVLMTEGALRSVVRGAGDAAEEFLIGRVRFDGDLSAPPGPLTVTLQVAAAYGVPFAAGCARLRTAVREALERHTAFRATRIDIHLRDVLVPRRRP